MRPVLQQTLALIKKYEGFRSQAYPCPAGVWTIGYGTTLVDGRPIRPGETISESLAHALLAAQVATFQTSVLKLVEVPLNDNQLSALVSFVYNVGVSAFKSSTLLRLLNGRDYAGASAQFDRWVRAGGVALLGLKRRRQEERALFEKLETKL